MSTASASAQPLSPTVVSSRLAGLHAVDYFPAANAWDNMWTNFNPSAMAVDFARIAAMHGNAVRIIPRVSAFGYPQPSAVMLARLAQTVALAKQYGLRVVLTMFDGFSNYADVAGSEQWAAAVLGPYAGSPEIAYVDLKNEINLQPPAALAWAQRLLPYVHNLLAGVPVTASVTINEGSQNLQTVLNGLGSVRPDLYDVHFYGQDGQAYSRLRAVQQLVAPAPVVLGETGYATNVDNATVPGLAQTQASQEAYQEYYLRSVDYAARLLGIQAAPWILNDFTPAAWPGASAEQFGLYRVDGTPKPAVATEAAYFAGQALSTDFNPGFEQVTRVGSQLEPLLWREYQPAGVSAQFAADPTVAHSGSYSARISGTSGGQYGCASFYLVPISALSTTQTYTAQVYARGAGVTGGNYLSLSWFDANGVYLSQTVSQNLAPGTSTWTLLTASGKPPVGAAFVQLHLKSCNNAGSVWFDDVQFGPVPAAPTGTSATQAVTLRATTIVTRRTPVAAPLAGHGHTASARRNHRRGSHGRRSRSHTMRAHPS